MGRLSLGLDSSTQSLTGVLVDIDSGRIVAQKSLDYAADERLNRYGINFSEYTVPPREQGEADQPPKMYIASIDAMFADLKKDNISMADIKVINVSGQQHGHLYLNAEAAKNFAALKSDDSAQKDLVTLIGTSFSYMTAPIWKTSNTVKQADDLRKAAGGKEKMIRLSGSDSPLRFTGAVVRRVGEQFPDAYAKSAKIHLISSFIPAMLCGSVDVGTDFGNGCGTSLMDYEKKQWSEILIKGAAKDLAGGDKALAQKLPPIVAPDSIVGEIAAYYKVKYGFADCVIAAGSGDNPQTKVLIKGDLLSLGTSFVNMVATDGKTYDMGGYANAMYDGVGRPFMFGCRSNGAMAWDKVRAAYGLTKKDYGKAEEALEKTKPGSAMYLWQPFDESFPPCRAFEAVRKGGTPSLEYDYPGIIDSTLAAVYVYSKGFARDTDEPLYVTGGPASSKQIIRRIAGIWGRPVITIGSVGAGLGTAVAGAQAFAKHKKENFDAEKLSASALPRAEAVNPLPEDVAAYKEYLKQFASEYEKLIK